ncbi:MAG: sulfite exporter TauE/SafE family protein [Saprospiraceae bacterium]|nr:sulfite exporter TauE/SafE family protein [Saprospiraceae bacterium]
MDWWTALTIGLFGSLHCVGMCGPIAMALPFQDQNRWQILQNTLLYNGGRIATYAMIGILPGLVGQGLALGGFQKNMSIILGITFLIAAFFSFGADRFLQKIPLYRRFYFAVQNRLGHLLRSQSRRTFFSIGLLNGLLPCGLVYMALAGALTQSNMFAGAGYMAFFGLGTVPLMLSVALSKGFVSLRMRNFIRKVTPAFMVLFGLLLIFRGFHIDLPESIDTWMMMGYLPMCE